MRAFRSAAARKGLGSSEVFRWRGAEITRFEGFSDAVLAFAVTLLVVSLEVPRTFDELLHTMRGFPAFAICFAILIWVWYWQYVFFRRYGLQDRMTLVLNAGLLFVVLFYVYPLKFLFTLALGSLAGVPEVRLPDGRLERVILPGQGATLMLIYSAGFVAVFLLFAVLYHHAYRKRSELELTGNETALTRESVQRALLAGSVGALSMAIAGFRGEPGVPMAGFCYFLLGPVLGIHGALAGRRRRRRRRPG
jgi:transmembrane protein TMEM174 (potassium channel)